jgi:ribose-phosphate pyrophosphokinase
MGILFSMPGNERLAAELGMIGPWAAGALEIRRFPDGESYVRILSDVAGHRTAILCTLARPDSRFLRLVFTARTLKELGASAVTLIAPYLSYMRQDIRFEPGEALTSRHFADLLSQAFDRLITVDPHLHRYGNLREIYSIPATALSSAPLLARWVQDNIDRPVIIGPDSESEQWVSSIAGMANAPYLVLEKKRLGDRVVEIKAPDLARWKQCRPVIVDDIVSSGATLVETAKCLQDQGLPAPACLIVHALLGERAQRSLAAVAFPLISTNTVPHATNGISIAAAIAGALDPEER